MANNLKIKYAMLKNGVSQAELGRRLGVDQSTISRKLNGRQLEPEEHKEFMKMITQTEE